MLAQGEDSQEAPGGYTPPESERPPPRPPGNAASRVQTQWRQPSSSNGRVDGLTPWVGISSFQPLELIPLPGSRFHLACSCLSGVSFSGTVPDLAL